MLWSLKITMWELIHGHFVLFVAIWHYICLSHTFEPSCNRIGISSALWAAPLPLLLLYSLSSISDSRRAYKEWSLDERRVRAGAEKMRLDHKESGNAHPRALTSQALTNSVPIHHQKNFSDTLHKPMLVLNNIVGQITRKVNLCVDESRT